MFSFFTLVLVVVVVLWAYAMGRQGDTSSQAVQSAGAKRWILGGGLILPLVSITVLLIVGIPSGQYILTLPEADAPALRVNVRAHRWWWEFHYPESGVTTANQLYMPAGAAVEFYVDSDNVIHSFWIPGLGGKIDVIPGRTNRILLQADAPGTLRGQCAEFCGTGHAYMIFPVQVLSTDDFQQWLTRQQQPVSVAAEHQPAAQDFVQHCGDCHAVSGISEGGRAPDLSNLGDRRLLGTGRQRGQTLSILEWLQTHPARAEHTPDHTQIAPDRQTAIAHWLETLN